MTDQTDQPEQADHRERPEPGQGAERRLRLDDVELVPEQTSDDTDAGWGRGLAQGGPAAELRRYLDEKPPHHGD